MIFLRRRLLRRRRYFIKKSFQTKFIIGFIGLLIVQAFLVVALFTSLASQTFTTGYQGARLVIDRTSSFFFINFLIMSAIVGITVVLAGITVFIVLSHRIAGPLYKCEKMLHDMSTGNVSARMRLRKTDQLGEFENAFNMVLHAMDSRIGEVKRELEEAERLLSSEGREKRLDELEEILKKIKESIAFFKTS